MHTIATMLPAVSVMVRTTLILLKKEKIRKKIFRSAEILGLIPL